MTEGTFRIPFISFVKCYKQSNITNKVDQHDSE